MSVEKTPDPLQQVVVATSYETKAVGGAVSAPLSPQSACAERRQYLARRIREARRGVRKSKAQGLIYSWCHRKGQLAELVLFARRYHARKPKQALGGNDKLCSDLLGSVGLERRVASGERPARSGVGGVLLSLFPGIGLLDRAFEETGFCVVRGPDLIWGGDVRAFHPPAGLFVGIIGGPPCQIHSRLRHLNPRAGQKHGDMIPEFVRCVHEAQPDWWLMEEVPEAPIPVVPGYKTHSQLLNNRWVGGVQHRKRRFTFGTRDGRKLHIETVALESGDWSQAVTSSCSLVPVALGGSGKAKRKHPRSGPADGPRIKIEDMLRLQGLPETHLAECPLTADGKRQAIGNGVPLPLGRALASAVRWAAGAGRGAETCANGTATKLPND